MVAALSVRGLTVAIPGAPPLVDAISFDLAPGEACGFDRRKRFRKVADRECALCGLLRPPIAVQSGSVRLDGRELMGASPAAWRQARGAQIFQIFQSPSTALTPGRRIGPQLIEAARRVRTDPKSAVPSALEAVHLDPKVVAQFPYQLSGGMKQRALIAMALILRPRVLIADEPTTGLDVLTERDTLASVNTMARETGAAVLFISHDLRAVREVAKRVLVLHQGQLVEDSVVDGLATSSAPAAQRLAEAAIALQDAC